MLEASGSGSGRPKVIRILRIRIRIYSTEPMRAKSQKAQQESSFRYETANEKSAREKMRDKK
jgi:hypothetical protein